MLGTILIKALTIFVRMLQGLLWARILMAWFRPRYRTSSNRWFFVIDEYVWRATEPLLAPIRNILPSTGMIDFSPLILWFLIDIVYRVLVGALASL